MWSWLLGAAEAKCECVVVHLTPATGPASSSSQGVWGARQNERLCSIDSQDSTPAQLPEDPEMQSRQQGARILG